MDFDRIKKLIALANNNPNDNEANLAARRVCKFLGENEFSLVNKVNQSKQTDGFPFNPSNSQWNFYDDLIRKYQDMYREVNRSYDIPRKERNWAQTSYTSEGNTVYGSIFRDPPKKEKPKKILKCKTCQIEIETGFVGPSVMFECSSCQWTRL